MPPEDIYKETIRLNKYILTYIKKTMFKKV